MAKIKRNRNGTRKDVIIAKAAKLFREKGFSATSMRDLAEHVGVEAASLYNHISSKAEILQEICFKTANNFMSHIEEVDATPNMQHEIVSCLKADLLQDLGLGAD